MAGPNIEEVRSMAGEAMAADADVDQEDHVSVAAAAPIEGGDEAAEVNHTSPTRSLSATAVPRLAGALPLAVPSARPAMGSKQNHGSHGQVALSIVGESIEEAVAGVMSTRGALFKASRDQLPIPRCCKFLGSIPKAWMVFALTCN